MARDELIMSTRWKGLKMRLLAIRKLMNWNARTQSRIHLMEVSRDFKSHSEDEVRALMRMPEKPDDLAVAREQEKICGRQRYEQEIRLRNLGELLPSGTTGFQIGVVLISGNR